MGMCLESKGPFAVEVRRESIILGWYHAEGDVHSYGESVEFDMDKIYDLRDAINEAIAYAEEHRGLKPDPNSIVQEDANE